MSDNQQAERYTYPASGHSARYDIERAIKLSRIKNKTWAELLQREKTDARR